MCQRQEMMAVNTAANPYPFDGSMLSSAGGKEVMSISQ